MKIMLLGRDGQLGWELQRALAPLGQLVAIGRGDRSQLAVDLADLDSVARSVHDMQPDIIVNAAGYTAVDRAESESDLARRINSEAPAVLAGEAKKIDALLVHYSTDYVFDGSGTRPWCESDQPNPINIYGATKAEGEQAIKASGCRHFVVRTSWVYSTRGHQFVKTILRLAQEKQSLKIIDDQIGAPTGAELIADITSHLILSTRSKTEESEILHLAAAGETSWYGYARHIVERARDLGWQNLVADDAIEPISSDAYPTAAVRPHNSRLNCGRLEKRLNLRLPQWQSGVDRVVAEIYTCVSQGALI